MNWRHVSSVLDVCTFRGFNADWDHYLVVVKIRTPLCISRNVRQQKLGRFDVEKQSKQLLSTRLLNLISESTNQQLDIRALWNDISNTIRTAATKTVVFRQCEKKIWYTEECRTAVEWRQPAYLETLRWATTRAGCIDTESWRKKHLQSKEKIGWNAWIRGAWKVGSNAR